MALPPLELFSLERKGRLFAGRSFRFYADNPKIALNARKENIYVRWFWTGARIGIE